jgi:voltage-gated potassium channel
LASAEERWSVLEELDDWLRLPMALLGLTWLLIVVAELLWGENALLLLASTAVWVIFIAEFALWMLLAPDRWRFLRSNWLKVVALIVPALRSFRAIAVLRAARALRA